MKGTRRAGRAGLVLLAGAVLLATSVAHATSLTRGPYLQLLTTQSVTVVWNTDAPAACAVALRPLGGVTGTVVGTTGTTCAVPLAGLTPGGQYGYTPLADGMPLGGESIFQVDSPALAFSFLVLGDSGSGSANQAAVRDAMLATPGDTILLTGDMVYPSGAAGDFNPKFFTPYQELLRRLVLWPSLGEADVAADGGASWRAAFSTPANNPAATEHYYSFDMGNAHVVVLDSNGSLGSGSAQRTWLDQDLAATSKLWKFVVVHRSLYSNGVNGSDTTLRTSLTPIFDNRHVDVVFMGRDHDYERTKSLQGNAQIVADGVGTVYVTTGGGGDSLRAVGSSAFTAFAESTYHFVRVAVNGGSLLLQMIRADGAVRDAMALTKGTPGPAPACGNDVVDQAGEQCDGPDHAACPGGCTATCTCAPRCGDGIVNQTIEACDGTADAACPGLCLSTCQCGAPGDVVTVTPIADTYIESGNQATWDHGAADHLDVDQKPVDLTYLKFDLGLVQGPIARATLTLSCSNGGADGGTIYPVPDTGWIEGDRTGADSSSATGTGLKFADVDTNGDGKIDRNDTSPYAPDLDRWAGRIGVIAPGGIAEIDVTAAMQNGPGLYGLAIRNDDTNGAVYAAREHVTSSLRPRLRVEVATTTATTTSSTSSTGSTTTSSSTSSSTTDASTTTTSSSSSSSSTGGSTTSTSSSSSSSSSTGGSSTSTSSSSSSSSSTGGSSTSTSSSSSSSSSTGGSSTSTSSSSSSSSTGGSSTSTSSSSSSSNTGGSSTSTSSSSSTSSTVPPIIIPGTSVLADAMVRQSSAGSNFGTNALLEARESPGSSKKGSRTFIRVRVTGLAGRPAVTARVRLPVASNAGAGSASGGRMHAMTNCTWNELTMTWSNQPTFSATVLSTVGTVQSGGVAEFEVAPAIAGDGDYCFAIDSLSTDVVNYNAREASGAKPSFVVGVAP